MCLRILFRTKVRSTKLIWLIRVGTPSLNTCKQLFAEISAFLNWKMHSFLKKYAIPMQKAI